MKYKIMSFLFALMIIGGFVMHLLVPDKEISYEERRKLVQFPVPTVSTVFDGSFMERFDKYVADQFVFRRFFRGVKNGTEFLVFGKLDVHDIYEKDGGLYENAKPSEAAVKQFAEKLASLVEAMPDTVNVFYSIIPDKSAFIDAGVHPVFDTEAVYEALSVMDEATPIRLDGLLTDEDFYRTDIHWRQERLWPVVSAFADAMGFAGGDDIQALKASLSIQSYEPFYGAYYGRYALPIRPDRLDYLVGDVFDSVKVTDLATGKPMGLYATDRLGAVDSYDVYVGGALPCVKLENDQSLTNRRLVMFRDSYGSAIAPLLIPFYSEITMVDLRYMSSKFLADYVTFEDQDVLFLYSAMLANQHGILK